MKVFCDSSTTKACCVIAQQPPIFQSYDHQVTVNEGEYIAVIFALNEALRRKRTSIELFTDSQVVVNQVNGVWRCNYEHLEILRDKVRGLAQGQNVMIEWVPREENLAGKFLG